LDIENWILIIESTPKTQYEKVSKILFCPLVFPFKKGNGNGSLMGIFKTKFCGFELILIFNTFQSKLSIGYWIFSYVNHIVP